MTLAASRRGAERSTTNIRACTWGHSTWGNLFLKIVYSICGLSILCITMYWSILRTKIQHSAAVFIWLKDTFTVTLLSLNKKKMYFFYSVFLWNGTLTQQAPSAHGEHDFSFCYSLTTSALEHWGLRCCDGFHESDHTKKGHVHISCCRWRRRRQVSPPTSATTPRSIPYFTQDSLPLSHEKRKKKMVMRFFLPGRPRNKQ